MRLPSSKCEEDAYQARVFARRFKAALFFFAYKGLAEKRIESFDATRLPFRDQVFLSMPFQASLQGAVLDGPILTANSVSNFGAYASRVARTKRCEFI
jgi:hypothetical protein